MINKCNYDYLEVGDGIQIIGFNDETTDTLYIPKEIDGETVNVVSFDERSEYQNIKVLSISADLKTFYLHSCTFFNLEKIIFEEDFDGTAEFVRNLVWLWAFKNIKKKMTIPEILFKGKPTKFIVNQGILLSNDGKKMIAALTRESFMIPKSVNTICTNSIIPTFKKTSVIMFHSGITTIENDPFWYGEKYINSSHYLNPQKNYIPLNVENIGSGLILKMDYSAGSKTKNDKAHFVYNGERLIIRTGAQNITEEGLLEIVNLWTVTEVVIENENSCFSVENGLLFYKNDTLVRAIRKRNNNNTIYIPEHVKKSYIDGVRAENKTESILQEESDEFISNNVEFVTAVAGMFNCKDYPKTPDIKVPLTNMFRLKNPVAIEKLEVQLSDLKIPPTRKAIPDYGFAIDESCRYIKELILPEGLTDFAIAKNLDGTSFALRKIVFPSTISLPNILPKLNQFKNLMLVVIKPDKKIQVKFGGLHYIVANVKKKKFDGLFYTYSYSGIYPEENPYSRGSYGGITYVSHFKEENLLYYGNGYYYLGEDEKGKFYTLLKTDFVDTFVIPGEINGIEVREMADCCLSNVKNVNDECYPKNNSETLEEKYDLNEDSETEEYVDEEYVDEEFIDDDYFSEETEDLKTESEVDNDESYSFTDLKVVLNFSAKNKNICNVEFKFDKMGIPLFFERYPDANSIYGSLFEILKNKEYVNEFLSEKFKINTTKFNQLTDIEKSLIIFYILHLSENDYGYNISEANKSKKHVQNIVSESLIINKIFDDSRKEKTPIIVNVLPDKIKKSSNKSTINVYFDLDNMKLSLDELFDFAEGDLEDLKIIGYNMFCYNFESLEEVEEMYDEGFISCLSDGEYSYFSEVAEEEAEIAEPIKSEIDLMEWIVGEPTINIIKYNKDFIRFKFPWYILECNDETYFDETKFYGEIFKTTKSPKISISLKEYFEQDIPDNESIKEEFVEGNVSEETSVEEVSQKKEQIVQTKTKKNTGYTAKNEAILSAPNLVAKLNLATIDYVKNHSDEEAVEYSKKMQITAKYHYAVYANDMNLLHVSATANRERGVQISCNCDEYKTKSNPCVHARALYYLLLNAENKNKVVEQPQNVVTVQTVTSNTQPQSVAPNKPVNNNVEVKKDLVSKYPSYTAQKPIVTKTSYTHYKQKGFEFSIEKLDSLVPVLLVILFIMVFVAVVCSYLVEATLTWYSTYQGEIVSRPMYSTISISEEYGFFYVLMFAGAFGGIIAGPFIPDNTKKFIPFIVTTVCSLIASMIISSCISRYSYVNDITYIPYYDSFESIKQSSTVTGPGDFASTLFVIVAIVSAVIAIIKYKKEN